MEENIYQKVYSLVYDFPTQDEFGFLPEEIKLILNQLPTINMDKYNDAMMGNTCMMVDDGMVIYHIDLHQALICGIEGRDQKIGEWD